MPVWGFLVHYFRLVTTQFNGEIPIGSRFRPILRRAIRFGLTNSFDLDYRRGYNSLISHTGNIVTVAPSEPLLGAQ